MKLSKAIEEFILGKERSKATVRAYRRDLDHLIEFVDDKDFKSITAREISCLLASLSGSASSRLRVLYTYSSLWSYMSEMHGLPNVMRYVAKPKVQEGKFTSLSEEEFNSFQKRARQDTPRNAFMCLLMAHTGIRVSEVKNLKLWQINAEYIHEVEGKSKLNRTIPFPDKLKKDAIRFLNWRQLHKHEPRDYVFCGVKDSSKPLNEKTIYSIVSATLIKAGVCKTKAHPHALRHTYAKRILKHIGRQEKNLAEALVAVRRLMGHAYISTTMKYTKHTPLELKKYIRSA